jgi:hypothetical protein
MNKVGHIRMWILPVCFLCLTALTQSWKVSADAAPRQDSTLDFNGAGPAPRLSSKIFPRTRQATWSDSIGSPRSWGWGRANIR